MIRLEHIVTGIVVVIFGGIVAFNVYLTENPPGPRPVIDISDQFSPAGLLDRNASAVVRQERLGRGSRVKSESDCERHPAMENLSGC